MPQVDGSPKICLVSLGCPKNLVDSEKMLALLASGGCIVAAPMAEADVIIVNTCAFLASARREAIEVIAEALEHKRRGRARRVIVAGCLPARDGAGVYDQAPGVDAVIDVRHRGRILAAVKANGRFTRVAGHIPVSCPSDTGRFRLTPRHTAFLRLSEGCSQRCSYCTIPAIRGPLRSKPPRAILREARELIADGAVELNLIAQNTTNYGLDLPSSDARANLASLLRQLDAIEGAEWIRLMYAYPRRFTDELIDSLAQCRHVVPYVDIPLQHITDEILRRMRRGVTRKAIESLLAKLRRRIDGLVIRTTLIVGFPGETDAQFDELLSFVRAFRFDALGVFEYSPEEGTPAAKMPDQVPADVKADRAHRIMLAQQRIALRANRRAIGQPVTVLVDGADPEGRCVGRHYGQAPEIDSLCLLTRPRKAGRFIQGTIVGSDGYDLIVQPVR